MSKVNFLLRNVTIGAMMGKYDIYNIFFFKITLILWNYFELPKEILTTP